MVIGVGKGDGNLGETDCVGQVSTLLVSDHRAMGLCLIHINCRVNCPAGGVTRNICTLVCGTVWRHHTPSGASNTSAMGTLQQPRSTHGATVPTRRLQRLPHISPSGTSYPLRAAPHFSLKFQNELAHTADPPLPARHVTACL